MKRIDANRDATVVALYAGGATMQEIADISGGVSRERVRQLLKRNGVEGGYNAERIDPLRVIAACRKPSVRNWSAVACEVGHPTSGPDLKKIAAGLGMGPAIARLFAWRSRNERARFGQATRAKLIAQYQELAKRLGRPPSSGELRPENGVQFWVVFFKYFPNIRALRVAAGFDPDDDRIVRKGKQVQPHCKRGHLLSETRTRWGYCGVCRKARDRERYQKRRAGK